MSNTAPIPHAQAAAAKAPRHSSIVTVLATAGLSALVASLLTAQALGPGQWAAERPTAAAAAAQPAAASTDTSVPPAATAFDDADLPAEVPPPTF